MLFLFRFRRVSALSVSRRVRSAALRREFLAATPLDAYTDAAPVELMARAHARCTHAPPPLCARARARAPFSPARA
jgi:hypothetical protein